MSYIVYKLNIQPDVLSKYAENNDKEYLLSEVIPSVFENVMEIKKTEGLFELITESVDEEIFKEQFKNLEKKTLKLLKHYQNVLSEFKQKHAIHYSRNFLNLNEECMDKRRKLEYQFPGIKRAYELITDEEIDEYTQIVSDSKVGTGITHLRKFFKIELYLEQYKEENAINPLDLKAYYNPHTEHVLVKSISAIASWNYILALVKLINQSSFAQERIGKININPIYESILLDQEYTEISYIIVYPNGNPPLDRHNILRESEAKEERTTLVGTDGKPLKNEPIQMKLEKEAKDGYLKSVAVKGGVVSKILKRLSVINRTS